MPYRNYLAKQQANKWPDQPIPDVSREQAVRILNNWIGDPASLSDDDLFVQIEEKILPYIPPANLQTPHTQAEHVKASFTALTNQDYNVFAQKWERRGNKLHRREGIRNDVMPRNDRQLKRSKMLNMRSADEIMQTTLGSTDPGPEMFRETGTDPNSFEKVAGIKMARKSRAISRKQRKGHRYVTMEDDTDPKVYQISVAYEQGGGSMTRKAPVRSKEVYTEDAAREKVIFLWNSPTPDTGYAYMDVSPDSIAIIDTRTGKIIDSYSGEWDSVRYEQAISGERKGQLGEMDRGFDTRKALPDYKPTLIDTLDDQGRIGAVVRVLSSKGIPVAGTHSPRGEPDLDIFFWDTPHGKLALWANLETGDIIYYAVGNGSFKELVQQKQSYNSKGPLIPGPLGESCGPQEIDLGLHDGMEVVAGLLGMNQDGVVDIDQAGDDFTLDDDWFDTATQELLDRTSTGEDWVVLVSELSRRFSEFFDGSYAAFSFAADAFGRRAWKMGMVENQIAADNFDLTESFYGDKFPLLSDHAPVRVSKDEFTRFVREERLTDHKGHKFVWFVDRAGKARAGIHETGHYIWQMKTPTVTHRGIVFRVGHPDLVETKTFTIYTPTNRMIKFGK